MVNLFGHYIINNDGQPVPCEDFLEFARWMDDMENRKVARDDVPGGDVSTVYIGIDVGAVMFNRPPRLWETLVFARGSWSGYQERYVTRAEAEAGHARIVSAIRTGKIREN